LKVRALRIGSANSQGTRKTPALVEKISTRPDPDGTNRKRSLLNLDSHDLRLEAIRETEDWDGLILRLYEMHNKRGRATIDLWREFGKARSTDLLEETVAGVNIQRLGGRFAFLTATIRSSH